jgi:hypothetical protein
MDLWKVAVSSPWIFGLALAVENDAQQKQTEILTLYIFY